MQVVNINEKQTKLIEHMDSNQKKSNDNLRESQEFQTSMVAQQVATKATQDELIDFINGAQKKVFERDETQKDIEVSVKAQFDGVTSKLEELKALGVKVHGESLAMQKAVVDSFSSANAQVGLLVTDARARLNEVLQSLIGDAQASLTQGSGGPQQFNIGETGEKRGGRSVLDSRYFKMPDLPEGKIDIDIFRKWRKDSESYLESFPEC